jgi:hypothetical protein
MVTYSHTIGLQQGQSLNLTTDLIRVTRRDELAPALKQRTKPVVIDNGDLERAFSRLEFWSGREGTYRFGALLVARHRGFDWLISSHFRMGSSLGAMSSSMLRGTPGWRRMRPARSRVTTI